MFTNKPTVLPQEQVIFISNNEWYTGVRIYLGRKHEGDIFPFHLAGTLFDMYSTINNTTDHCNQ